MSDKPERLDDVSEHARRTLDAILKAMPSLADTRIDGGWCTSTFTPADPVEFEAWLLASPDITAIRRDDGSVQLRGVDFDDGFIADLDARLQPGSSVLVFHTKGYVQGMTMKTYHLTGVPPQANGE